MNIDELIDELEEKASENEAYKSLLDCLFDASIIMMSYEEYKDGHMTEEEMIDCLNIYEEVEE